MHRSFVAIAVVAVLASCTTPSADLPPDPGPTPTVTPTTVPTVTATPARVGVVLDPRPELVAAAAEVGVRGMVRSRDEFAEVRVVRADAAAFLTDLVAFFTTEGYDLVCAAGDGAAGAVTAVAPTSPGTRYCAVPATGQTPANVLPIDVRIEELGYLAGVALATDLDAGPVGLITSPTVIAPARFEAGIAAGIAEVGLADGHIVRLPPARTQDDIDQVVTRMAEQRVTGVVSLAGDLDGAVMDALDEFAPPPPEPTEAPTEAPTDGPTDPSEPTTPTPTESDPPRTVALVGGPGLRPIEDGVDLDDQVLLVLDIHLEAGVEVALDRLAGTWDVAPIGIGMAEQALRVLVGVGDRAGAIVDAVEQARTRVLDGTFELPE